ncbi:hypothetical protein RB614_15915 [Phytohabitans sp. ZYX-F-186]|uniref:Squalene cyclase C-terminal domain-containing protein n=1 Tax=Phytohabitans maris TaxID=3071409 RepID=A0ABU0ZG05_9ACTN|nr:hypothetical protein [Phytohabitans sp. ZYX-F-186]
MAASSQPEPGRSRPDRAKWSDRLRLLLRALAGLGPFALTFSTYSLLLDHLPEEWFSQDWLRYVFAVVIALCAGLLLRLILQPKKIGAGDLGSAKVPEARQSVENDHGTLPEIFDGTRRRLLHDYRCRQRGDTEVCGWSQFYGDDVPPSAIGSSYGLRIAMALDVRDVTVERHRVIESILAMQRPGGGWSASNQREVGRPEVTAWVLGALVPAGLSRAVRQRLVGTLERMLDEERDPDGMRSTCVVTSAVSTLARFAPDSPLLPDLVDRLTRGTAGGDRDRPRWAATLGDKRSTGSVPHTARAIVALHRVAAVLPERRELSEQARAAAEWVCESFDLGIQDEQIRRKYNDEVDALLVYHFTPAWVARALLLEGHEPLRSTQLKEAVRAVVRSQERGIWRWRDREPIWMAYQGVSVLRDVALRARAPMY